VNPSAGFTERLPPYIPQVGVFRFAAKSEQSLDALPYNNTELNDSKSRKKYVPELLIDFVTAPI
jgi:hypothetical protein